MNPAPIFHAFRFTLWVIAVGLCAMKIMGVLDASWIAVTFPLWIVPSLIGALILCIGALVVAVFAGITIIAASIALLAAASVFLLVLVASVLPANFIETLKS